MLDIPVRIEELDAHVEHEWGRVVAMRPVVFGRTGWLEHYDSKKFDEGAPQYGGSFNDDNKGSELDNFRPIRGYVYGYIQTPGAWNGINPDRVERMHGALVVLCAKHPDLQRQVVVGWYEDATLYPTSREIRSRYGLYNFRARAQDAVLLPVSERTWSIPKQKGALGQANIFYILTADGQRRRETWIDQILGRIDEHGDGDELEAEFATAVASVGQGIGLSKAERNQIEEWAMVAAERHYRGKRYKTERRGQPFDLLCRRGRKELRVEVKGTTGSGASVIVTNGEVESARTHATDLFVLSEIELTAEGAKGGRKTVISPWSPDDSQLRPKVLQYKLPT